jgi:phasin family protein
MANIMLQGTEKIIALNMAASKASGEDATAAARGFLAVKDPQAFFALTTQLAKPTVEKITAYNQHLTNIMSAAKTDLTKLAETQATKLQSTVGELVSAIAKNAPDGSQGAVAFLKSSVASANEGYEKVQSAAKQAIAATEEHVAKASGRMADAVKESAPH